MKAVIQRVGSASVSVDRNKIARIGQGLVILLGVARDDEEQDVRHLAEKIVKLRIFSDENKLMNRSVLDVKGSALIVSQFTLLADTTKGNRPSFIAAAAPDKAKKLYELFIEELKCLGVQQVEKGQFGAYMQVELVNDGPVTMVLEA